MAIKMTRAEYEAKYGVSAPVAPVAPTTAPTAPVKMTRAEYEAKYGKSVDAPAGPDDAFTSGPIGSLPVIKQANQFGVGIGTALGKAALGVPEAALRVAGAIEKKVRGTDYGTQEADAVKKLKEGVFKKPYKKTLESTSGKAGEVVGNVLPYVVGAGEANAATKGMSFIPRVLARTAVDTGIAAAESGGDAKATGGAGVTSLVANAVLPGAGGVSKDVTRTFGKKALDTTVRVARNIIPGYVSDVTQGVLGERGEDRKGGKAFIPGAGTAFSTVLAAGSEGMRSYANYKDTDLRAKAIAENRHRELSKTDSYPGLKKSIEKGRDRGIDVKRIVSDTDVLHGAVDNNGIITTKGEGGAIEQYTHQFIDGNEGIVSEALKKEGRAISPAQVEKKLTEAVMNAGIEGSALVAAKKKIKEEIAGYAIRSGENGVIPLTTLHDAKIDKYNGINFFTEGNAKKYDKTVAKALKELVEENTTSIDVKDVNKELSKHFAVIDYLERLDNKRVEGGKLGKYFAKTVGAIVGSHFGPLGAMVGAEAGGAAKGTIMSKAFNGKTGNMPVQGPAIKNAVDFVKSKPLELPPAQSSNSVGNLNNAQSTNIINENTANIPKTIPRKGAAAVGAVLAGAAATGAMALATKPSDPIQYEAPKTVLPKAKPPAIASTTQDKYSAIHRLTTGTEVREIPEELKQHIIKAQKSTGLPKGLLEGVLMKESSAGSNATNSNLSIGKYAWLVGFTKIAKKELERNGKTVDLNTKAGAIQAAADYLALNSKKFKNPTELYANAYSSGKLPKKSLNQFRDMYNYYASR